ncbi:MAG TPA: sigma-54 dependent transcriptional regulator [Burkholderiales bacterium]|nr:sigma-54 dependent transcriptional regulator [Burkholderiales bacterium]
MPEKKLLLVDVAGTSATIARELEAAGWSVASSPSIEASRVAAICDDVAVGLIVLSKPLLLDIGALERLVNIGSVEWIALLPESMPQDPELMRLLVSSFYDYHTCPVDMGRLLVVLGHAWGRTRLKDRIRLPQGLAGRYAMVGASEPMMQLFAKIERMTRVDAPVLITGESGTGKELVARAIHKNSERAHGPFVPVNCGALPDNLVQSELFGHERGAFTGAHQRKAGSFEIANGGTVFLDEIGDLPLEQQANLLRFVQEKTIVRVGSTHHLRIDARVIAATHVDLERAVEANRFRQDLFYRLNVLHLSVPPLRARGRDIELLINAAFKQFAPQKNPVVQGFSQEAIRAALAYSWPGNVRELMNRVQRAMIMSENRLITAEDLALPDAPVGGNVITLSRARSTAEREAIQITLRNNSNNISRAARELGVSRVTLYRLMDKFNIDPNREG